jgi:type II secretory pathway pseudopilin PulG
MRCFAIGIVGFLVAGLLAAIAIPSYGNYTSRATLSETMAAIAPLRDKIAESLSKTSRNPSDNGSALAPRVSIPNVNYLKVMPDGTIVFRSAKHGQLIVYEPEVRGSTVVWKCIGAPVKDVPPTCR